MRRTLTPWLLGRQPLVDARALDDFSGALLEHLAGLAGEQQDAETLGNRITVALGRFVRLLQQRESPLESAFLVGLAAYGGAPMGWAALSNADILASQVPIESYRVDLVLRDLVGGCRWAIELDGHTYHERTEGQAAYDRARDRALTAAGWTIVRFHRRDVKRDLCGCVHELINLCNLPPALPVSIDPAAIEEARTALHEHQERQAKGCGDGDHSLPIGASRPASAILMS